MLATFAGWVNRKQAETIDYLIQGYRVLREQFGHERHCLTNDQRAAGVSDHGFGFSSVPGELLTDPALTGTTIPAVGSCAGDPDLPSGRSQPA